MFGLFKEAKRIASRVDEHWPHGDCTAYLDLENAEGDGEYVKAKCTRCGKKRKVLDPTRGFRGLRVTHNGRSEP